MANILVFDIEATNLKANFGTVLCIGYKWIGRKTVHVPSILNYNKICKPCGRVHDPDNDKPLLQAFSKIYNSADIVVSWYGRGFDVPFLQTRLLDHKLPPLAPTPHIDGCKDIAQKFLKLHSNRLAAVQDFLQLKDNKTALKPEAWNEARAGKPRGIKYVVEHCRKDVLVLEEAYLRLRQLVPRHPNLGILHDDRDACPACGDRRVQSRGTYVSGSREYARFQCQACGAWFKEPKAVRRSGRLTL